jgi:hypothetical protein
VAKVHIGVVSKGYAESKHCLSELATMMRSGKPVIPVFYDVEPVHFALSGKRAVCSGIQEAQAKGRVESKWRSASKGWRISLGFASP